MILDKKSNIPVGFGKVGSEMLTAFFEG